MAQAEAYTRWMLIAHVMPLKMKAHLTYRFFLEVTLLGCYWYGTGTGTVPFKLVFIFAHVRLFINTKLGKWHSNNR
jgi:hypothetical protein